MMDRIKITMLGSSGAGKTCYMVGMYKMMNYGIDLNGFMLTADDSDDNIRFNDLWRSLMGEGPDRWPAPTGQEADTYNFNFYYSHRPVLGFNWFDYRGGALQDYKSASDSSMLRERLQDTSCLLICISGEHLSEDQLSLSVFEKVAISGINQLLGDTQSLCTKNMPPAVVIVITKYDLCKHRKKSAIIRDVKYLFSTLFASDAQWLVMICPVTLGDDLASNENQGIIAPENVHIPVIFSLFAELFKQHWNMTDIYEDQVQQLQKTSEGFLASLLKRKDIRSKEKEISSLEKRLEHIKEYIQKIYGNIDIKNKVDVFFNGESIKFYEFFK